MGKETEGDGPPQPILIQGSSIIEPAKVNEQTTSATTATLPSRSPTFVQDPSTVEEALAKVQFLQGNKPNTNGLLAFGLLFLFAVPMVLFIGTDADIIFDDGIFVCCFSMILGIVLILLAETKQNEWKKSVRLAKAEALRLTNAPVAEATKYRVTYVMGGIIIVVGLAFDIFPIVLVGVLFMLPSGLATMNHNTQVNQAFARMQEGFKKP